MKDSIRHKSCPNCDSIQNTDSTLCTKCGCELNTSMQVAKNICGH